MDKKISQLTAASTPLVGTETLPIVQAGSTVKATIQDVLGYVVNDSTNSVLKTVYSASDIGLKLDFANNVYQLGTISNSTGVIVNESAGTVKLGDADFAYSNGTGLIIDNSNSQIIKTTNQGNDIGLKLDFANTIYSLTDNDYGLKIDRGNLLISVGDYLGNSDGTSLFVNSSSQQIYTKWYNGSSFIDVGLNLDFANNVYWIGDVINGNMGFICEVGESKMGDYNGGGNGTVLGVSDSTEQIIATSNLTAATAGASSSLYLKIKVGGVDYKIALLNNA